MPAVPEAPVFPLLKGKVAIITGAAQGMGKVTSAIFLKAGAQVVMPDIPKEKGQAAVAELSSLGDIMFVKCDISKSDEVQNLVAKTVERYGRLDCAVNSAALTPDQNELTELDEEYWNRLMGINLTGAALCCKYEMQQMLKQGTGGSIVNISSTNGVKVQPNMPAYSTAKHGIICLTKHAAMEGGPSKIRSEMSAKALEIMGTTEEEFTKKCSYLRRFGQPHEVAQGSMWLASDASSYVTGVCIPIDGGMLIM